MPSKPSPTGDDAGVGGKSPCLGPGGGGGGGGWLIARHDANSCRHAGRGGER